MSRMFVVAIDDNEKAAEFLRSLQEHKVVAYQYRNVFRKAPVLFAYMTDEKGGILPPPREEE